MKLKTAIDRVACFLGDEKNAQVTREQIKCALSAAQMAVFAARRDEFVKTVSIKLVPGAIQRIPDKYTEFVGLHEAPIDPKQAIKDNSAQLSKINARYKGFCLMASEDDSAATYKVKSISATSKDRKAFIVDPPAPEGVDMDVKVLVIEPPTAPEEECDEVCVGADYQQAVVEYALYALMGAQQESAYMTAQAQVHYKAYVDIMRGAYNAEARLVSGYNLGLTGTGNERIGPPRDLSGVL